MQWAQCCVSKTARRANNKTFLSTALDHLSASPNLAIYSRLLLLVQILLATHHSACVNLPPDFDG